MPIRILLADDHEMLRAGLRAMLGTEADFQVVGEANDGRTAVRLATELLPDVVIMDIHMPDLNGIEATRQIRGDKLNGPKVVALSAHSDERYAREMLRAGATAFIPKVSAFEELADALRTVFAGKMHMNAYVANSIDGDHVRADGVVEPAGAFDRLTTREREVLQLLAEGKATKEVAQYLKVSAKTIETHRRNLQQKLSLYSLAELTKYAIREGLTTTDA